MMRPDEAPSETQVQVVGGRLRGTTEVTEHGPVHRFLGVAYAETPARFAAPTMVRPWDGTRSAAAFGPSPVQSIGGYADAVPGMQIGAVSEDCLTLNVWSPPRGGEALPVLVWIAGGAFVTGGTCSPTYDGARLAAEQDVVVVSANYRLGAFGFLDLRSFGGDAIGATPNCGLHDQLLALRWVRANIEAFGGDPSRVTLVGESAGAGSILHLVPSPRLDGLAHRAIAQSPGVDFTQHPDQAAIVTERLLAQVGVGTATELAAVAPEALLDAQGSVSRDLLFELGTMVFHPVVDDDIVAATPSVAFARGDGGDVDLLLGSTAHELRLFPDPRADLLGRTDLERWVSELLTPRMGGRTPSGAEVARLVDGYSARVAGTTRPSGSDLWAELAADGTMRLPVERIADAHSAAIDGSGRAGGATYAYTFAWESRHPTRDLGAFHAIDLPFVFDAFDDTGWAEFVGVDDAARRLGFALRSAWGAFARTGEPSCPAVGPWPLYDTTMRATKVLDVPLGIIEDPLAEQRALWDGLWDPACRPAGISL
ncbi:carboxylesterase family protein [soil metagenome]